MNTHSIATSVILL